MTGLITVASFRNRIEAEIAGSLLTANGIESLILADDGGGTNSSMLMVTGGARLIVHPDDAQRAAQTLQAVADAPPASSAHSESSL